MTIVRNYFAFFFSFFYLFAIGLWKKALTAIAAYIAIIFISAFLPFFLAKVLWLAVNLCMFMRTNVYFYELKVKGIQTWSLW